MSRMKDYRIEVPHNQVFIYETTARSMDGAIANVQSYLKSPHAIHPVVNKTEALDDVCDNHNSDTDEWNVTALN